MKRLNRTLLPLLLLVSLTACQNQTPIVSNSESPIPDSNVILINNLQIDTSGHFSDIQVNYLTSDDATDTTPYNGNLSKADPIPVSISWDDKSPDKFAEVEITPEGGETIVYQVNDSHLDFYNPIFNRRYTVSIQKGTIMLKGTFTENNSVPGPRNLKVDGVENFRDIGGWGKFENGAYKTFIKQGMIYRSGRFNEDKAEPVNVTISEDGIKEINNHLKIKTEIDLRRTSNNEVGSLLDKSVLGDNVKYVQLPMAYGGNNILTFKGKLSGDSWEYDNPAEIKEFFKVLADENNYPINFHCSIGKDRTGCLAYLVEGLLGFDQETMYRDYMFTNFANAGMCKITDITDRYGDTLAKYENGTTINEKIYNYLYEEIGVAKEYLDSVIRILKA